MIPCPQSQATGAHLYETSPSGNYFDFYAQCIGARSQSARTYLEKHFEHFSDCTPPELIRHCLLAIRESVGSGGEISARNCSIGIVGQGEAFHVIEGAALEPYLEGLEPLAGPAAEEVMAEQ